jgi:hypothetical protein
MRILDYEEREKKKRILTIINLRRGQRKVLP